MLEEKVFVHSINYLDSGHIEVRTAYVILKDDVEIARQYHRHVVEPDQEDLSGEDDKVRAIASAMAGHRSEKAKEKRMNGDPENLPEEPEPGRPGQAPNELPPEEPDEDEPNEDEDAPRDEDEPRDEDPNTF